jgi:hypothetical protein
MTPAALLRVSPRCAEVIPRSGSCLLQMLDIARQNSQQLVVSEAAGHPHGPGVVTVRILVLDKRKKRRSWSTSRKGRDLQTRENIGHWHPRDWIRHAGDASAAGEASTGAPVDAPERAAQGHCPEGGFRDACRLRRRREPACRASGHLRRGGRSTPRATPGGRSCRPCEQPRAPPDHEEDQADRGDARQGPKPVRYAFPLHRHRPLGGAGQLQWTRLAGSSHPQERIPPTAPVQWPRRAVPPRAPGLHLAGVPAGQLPAQDQGFVVHVRRGAARIHSRSGLMPVSR